MSVTIDTTFPLHTGTWDIDAAHTLVRFSVRHMTVARVAGRFPVLTGMLTVPENGDPVVNAEIEVGSVQSGHPKRDELITSAEFLDAESHPTIAFASTGFTAAGDDRYAVAGDLTIKGVTRAVVLDADFGGIISTPWRRARGVLCDDDHRPQGLWRLSGTRCSTPAARSCRTRSSLSSRSSSWRAAAEGTGVDLNLERRTAVITGGSAGIGLAVAAALLREGARVALLARDEAGLSRAVDTIADGRPDDVLPVVADITNRASVDAAAETVRERFGTVHILVNNAGHRMRRLDRQLLWDDEDWISDIDVKTVGALRATRAFYPLLDKTGAGRIVNIGGVAGEAVWEGALTHGVNNAALGQATRYLARDLGGEGITVNAVVPGLVATEWRQDWASAAADRGGVETDAFLEGYLEKLGVLLGRWAESEEVADAVTFLASDRAAYITGTSLVVDGGITVNAL